MEMDGDGVILVRNGEEKENNALDLKKGQKRPDCSSNHA